MLNWSLFNRIYPYLLEMARPICSSHISTDDVGENHPARVADVGGCINDTAARLINTDRDAEGMSGESEWIEAVLENVGGDGIRILRKCGESCAERNGHIASVNKLKQGASGCKDDKERAEFLRGLGLDAETVDGAIVLRFHKSGCTCPMYPGVRSPMLCECTAGHEAALWSEAFGVRVEAEILESFLRGGSDCVVRLTTGDNQYRRDGLTFACRMP